MKDQQSSEMESARSQTGAALAPSNGDPDGNEIERVGSLLEERSGEGWSGEYMKTPLVLWIKSCLSLEGLNSPRAKQADSLTFVSLCNGPVLNNVMLYIDPRSSRSDVCHYVRDVATRLKNLAILLANIQSFYGEVLHQLVVMPLPDLLTIARQPCPDDSGREMNKILLLLLGCAVQSDRREEFVERIKELDISLQHAIVEQIQRVTNNGDCVVNVQALELDPEDGETHLALQQLQRVAKERDGYLRTIVDLGGEHEGSDSGSSKSGSNGELCGHKLPEALQHDAVMSATAANVSSAEKRHAGVELADCKAKLRRIRQELEEKLELLAEYKDELSDKDNMLAKLRQENMELLKDARAAKSYRDELDILREKANKADHLEIENDRYRERLSELDFYKSRMEELRSENHMLLETRNLLEDQLTSARRQADQHVAAESQLLMAQKTVQNLLEELKSEREAVKELMEQNSALEQEYRSALRESSTKEKELSGLKGMDHSGGVSSSLSDQLSDSVNQRLLRLELENEQLRSQMYAAQGAHQSEAPPIPPLPSTGSLVSGSSTPFSKSSLSTTNAASGTLAKLDFVSVGSETASTTAPLGVSAATSPIMSSSMLAEKDMKIGELTRDLGRLNKEYESLQRTEKRSSSQCQELRGSLDKTMADKQEIEAQLDRLETDYQAQLERVEQLNVELAEELDALRQERDAAVATSAAMEKVKDETSNVEFEQKINELTLKLNELENQREDTKNRLSEVELEASRSSKEVQTLSSRLMELEKEKLNAEKRVYENERQNRWLEKENLKLKQLLEVADSDFEKHRTKIAELERDQSRLELAKKLGEEASTRLADLEVEKRHLASQLEFEQKNLEALRKDLITEKSRHSILQSQFQSLASYLDIPQQTLALEDVGMLESVLMSGFQKLKNGFMRDNDVLKSRISLLEQERDGALTDLEKQRARAQTEAAKNQALAAGQQRTTSASTDREMAEKLQSLEVRNSQVTDESKHVKEQVRLLQEQIRRLQTEASQARSEAMQAKQELVDSRTQEKRQSTLSSENAKLAVECRSNQLKAELFESDNTELQKQLLLLERDHQALRQNFDQMQKLNAELSSDHEMLQNLHTQLNRDYERVCKELNDAKASLKEARLDYHGLDSKLEMLQKEYDSTQRLKSRLEAEKASSDRDFKQLASLQSEHGALKRAYDDLKLRFEAARSDVDQMRVERRAMKEELNSATLSCTKIQGQLMELQETSGEVKLYASEMDQRCEMLQQLNATMKEESRTLMRQTDVLMRQNSELFNQALMDKDHFHAEEKELQEKLNNVRRQKEKLEEKIMDQYKMMDSPHKGKKGSNFTKRVKALISRTESRKNVNQVTRRSGSGLSVSEFGSGPGDSGSVNSSADEGGFGAGGPKGGGFGRTGDLYDERRGALSDNELDKSGDSSGGRRRDDYSDGAAFSDSEVGTPRSVGNSCSLSSGSNGSGRGKPRSGGRGFDSTKRNIIPSLASPTIGRKAVAPNGVTNHKPADRFHGAAMIVADEISLCGSERAVDVPDDPAIKHSPRRGFGTITPPPPAPSSGTANNSPASHYGYYHHQPPSASYSAGPSGSPAVGSGNAQGLGPDGTTNYVHGPRFLHPKGSSTLCNQAQQQLMTGNADLHPEHFVRPRNGSLPPEYVSNGFSAGTISAPPQDGSSSPAVGGVRSFNPPRLHPAGYQQQPHGFPRGAPPAGVHCCSPAAPNRGAYDSAGGGNTALRTPSRQLLPVSPRRPPPPYPGIRFPASKSIPGPPPPPAPSYSSQVAAIASPLSNRRAFGLQEGSPGMVPSSNGNSPISNPPQISEIVPTFSSSLTRAVGNQVPFRYQPQCSPPLSFKSSPSSASPSVCFRDNGIISSPPSRNSYQSCVITNYANLPLIVDDNSSVDTHNNDRRTAASFSGSTDFAHGINCPTRASIMQGQNHQNLSESATDQHHLSRGAVARPSFQTPSSSLPSRGHHQGSVLVVTDYNNPGTASHLVPLRSQPESMVASNNHLHHRRSDTFGLGRDSSEVGAMPRQSSALPNSATHPPPIAGGGGLSANAASNGLHRSFSNAGSSNKPLNQSAATSQSPFNHPSSASPNHPPPANLQLSPHCMSVHGRPPPTPQPRFINGATNGGGSPQATVARKLTNGSLPTNNLPNCNKNILNYQSTPIRTSQNQLPIPRNIGLVFNGLNSQNVSFVSGRQQAVAATGGGLGRFPVADSPSSPLGDGKNQTIVGEWSPSQSSSSPGSHISPPVLYRNPPPSKNESPESLFNGSKDLDDNNIKTTESSRDGGKIVSESMSPGNISGGFLNSNDNRISYYENCAPSVTALPHSALNRAGAVAGQIMTPPPDSRKVNSCGNRQNGARPGDVSSELDEEGIELSKVVEESPKDAVWFEYGCV